MKSLLAAAMEQVERLETWMVRAGEWGETWMVKTGEYVETWMARTGEWATSLSLAIESMSAIH